MSTDTVPVAPATAEAVAAGGTTPATPTVLRFRCMTDGQIRIVTREEYASAGEQVFCHMCGHSNNMIREIPLR